MNTKSTQLFQTELSDKYTLTTGPIWINGTQAITRLLLEQSRLDNANGINTAGFVSGYRGSPLGGVDQALFKEQKLLKEANIRFEPGVNEDLAATALWGTQQANVYPTAQYDGVFGLWYGKSPGLDRSGDVFRHANMAGTSPAGGVLALVGDDPGCKSSTLASTSVGALREFQIPVLTPSDIEDLLNLGLTGWALSRYSGCWVGISAITAIMDSATTVYVETLRQQFETPETSFNPHIRLIDTPYAQEPRIGPKLELAAQFCTANKLNYITVDSDNPRLAIFAVGKAYTDLRQALEVLGFSDERILSKMGIRIIKVGMVWPQEKSHVMQLVSSCPSVFVIEGKQPVLEDYLKSLLYGPNAPSIEGKFSRQGNSLIPEIGEVLNNHIVQALLDVFDDHQIDIPRQDIDRALLQKSPYLDDLAAANESRKPLFCPGCPHSVSTQIPEGSRALAGIGCHYMVQWMDRDTHTFTHMGGEGVNWIGQAPYVDDNHIFVNMGDGTYFHSGFMAIRASVAAGVNVTYKILFNDAVAMTGGQPVEGNLTVDDIVHQCFAENVNYVHIVTDYPERYEDRNYEVSHRDQLLEVEERMRSMKGCTVLIYDQVCANELRRRRKRGTEPLKMKRIVINDAVCEGCGDCTRASMCSAIEPLTTDLGIKRKINQTACNQDLSCLKGYCPAMIEVEAGLVEPSRWDFDIGELPEPQTNLPTTANILVAGVGGTGVVTLSQVLGMAAMIEGKHASNLDMTGLAQKGGAVFANVRISDHEVLRTQIPVHGADVLLGADLVTSLSRETVAILDKTKTNTVVNTHLIPTSKFVLNRQADEQSGDLVSELESYCQSVKVIDADRLSTSVCGTSTTANMALLGFAWQCGLIPLKAESIERALEINDTKVEDNILSFRAGRKFAVDANFIDVVEPPESTMYPKRSRSLEELLFDRVEFLIDYQNERYANRLTVLAERVQDVERRLHGEPAELSRSVIEAYFKLLAAKDEFEVARLLTHPNFEKYMQDHFSGVQDFHYAFAPTWLPKSQKSKIRIGAWMRPFLKLLAWMRGIRGSILDPFRLIEERQFEAWLVADFEAKIDHLCTTMQETDLANAVAMVRCYDEVRGYGHVKLASWNKVKDKIEALYGEIDESKEVPRRETDPIVA
ncbi:MAG: indolepyruvate ferredoxin oxidoreductase family protein [Gammaproteobacteria bacterium]|nr:indolepyruvate ferredoxin oxidoreductase family protein [Gammaproteobacteria bacterium]MDE0252163.1 indolepyruvate ferredoxin oxidoreductase family protein [Gammaproteobacteria bacterium]MDE0402728.1 indolepyruvate ferredoxin oxidoreductase family protein [Gammaproteobacteria bacterium]